MIHTALGPIEQVGKTYIHEHLTLDLSGPKQDPDANYDATAQVILELKNLKSLGIDAIVDVTNRGMGRKPRILAEAAAQTGLTIIASTGFYKEPFFPPYFYELSDDELIELLVNDVEHGMDGTNVKAHVLGEIGTSHNQVTSAEERLFRLVGRVHQRTGKPIFTHTTLGTMALEQISLLEDMAVDLSKVLIGHMDLKCDLDYHLKVADRGCYLGFDTIGKLNYQPDQRRVELIKELVARGHEDQIVMSLDLTRKSHLATNGGIGYSYLVDSFIPMLLEAGLRTETVDKFWIDNPNRLLNIS